MTEKEREAFYDAEIAPALKAMSEKCLANGLSFFSLVEWAPGETGQTTAFQPLEKRGLAITWCDWAAKANGSADAFLIAMQRHAHKYGHSSMCLHLLGVPTKPEEGKSP